MGRGPLFARSEMGRGIRTMESPRTLALLANYILVLHAIFAVAITCFMLRVIDDVVVHINSGEPWFRRNYLQVDDITTAVSASIVAIRIITGAWTSQSAWRCAFILLETQGLTLRQFNRMISWPAYLLRGSTDAYIATLILVLLIPANLVTPVVTGSVGWKEVVLEIPAAPFQHTGPMKTHTLWYWYSTRAYVELDVVVGSAASRAGVGWLDFGNNNTRSSRLVATSAHQAMAIGSVIDNLTLPYLEIHSISWDKNPDFSQNIINEIKPIGAGAKSRLTLSGVRPFDYYHLGNSVLFDRDFIANYSLAKSNISNWQAALPSQTVFRGTKKIVVLVAASLNKTNCRTPKESIFGSPASVANREDLYPSWDGRTENCFLIGTVRFTAGVIRGRATYVTPRVVEANVDPSTPIEADPWVRESLYLLPDVMVKVSLFNWTQIPTWDRLDGYLEDLIRISYQATWGQVAFRFNDSPIELTAHVPAQRLQAVVSRPRVLGWYGAQLLVLVSAALLWILQMRSTRPIAIDTGIVALLMDAAPILNEYDATQELSRMSYITKHDGGTVRLAERSVPNSGERARLGHYDPSSDLRGEAPLVGQDEPGAEAARPPPRFMLIPRVVGGQRG